MTGPIVEPEAVAKGMAEILHERTAALRKLAIIPMMMTGAREVVHNGHRCRVCATTWRLQQPELHADWCVLKGTER